MATRTVPTASLLLVCPAVATTRPGPLVSAAGRPGQLLECSTRAGAGPGSGAADSAAGLVRPMPAEPRVADGRPRRLAEPPDQRVGEADGAGQAQEDQDEVDLDPPGRPRQAVQDDRGGEPRPALAVEAPEPAVEVVELALVALGRAHPD